jgi:type IX secretion system PorP/SprF family membrane protein
MKNLYFVLVLFFLSVSAFAQQDPLYSQYMLNPFIINPAYAGYTTDLNASVMYRKQWAGFEGSPVTMNANAHIALDKNRMGAGLIVLQDQIGSDKNTEVNVAYSYHLSLSTSMKLSFGLQGGVINYHSDYSDLNITAGDSKFSNLSEWKPNLGAGLLLHNEKFIAGLSVPKMLKSSTTVESLSTGLYNQHLYVYGAYLAQLSYRIKLKPWILMRAVAGAPLAVDYALSVKIDDSYTIGLFTRNLNTYGFLMQLNLGDSFRMGYVFELPTEKSVGTRYPTHELTLGIRMGVLSFHDLLAVKNF